MRLWPLSVVLLALLPGCNGGRGRRAVDIRSYRCEEIVIELSVLSGGKFVAETSALEARASAKRLIDYALSDGFGRAVLHEYAAEGFPRIHVDQSLPEDLTFRPFVELMCVDPGDTGFYLRIRYTGQRPMRLPAIAYKHLNHRFADDGIRVAVTNYPGWRQISATALKPVGKGQHPTSRW